MRAQVDAVGSNTPMLGALVDEVAKYSATLRVHLGGGRQPLPLPAAVMDVHSP